jgi:2-polyprenyl-3-methyl-5-hydroxy-6-metoxy-1,4-benzoquinol methylase
MTYDTLNPQIVRYILEDAQPDARILDVGCGTGRLGRLLKLKINCHITGIDIDRQATDIAKDSYDEIMVIDLENLINKSDEFKSNKKFKFIIFGDILEHTTKPEYLLKYFSNFLEGDGFVIVSIPNIANWMLRIRLLFGNFDYKGGILDQGHLRFFTYRTARMLLEDNGYKIISVINNNQTRLFRFLGRLWKSMFAFQFVFKCVKR